MAASAGTWARTDASDLVIRGVTLNVVKEPSRLSRDAKPDAVKMADRRPSAGDGRVKRKNPPMIWGVTGAGKEI